MPRKTASGPAAAKKPAARPARADKPAAVKSAPQTATPKKTAAKKAAPKKSAPAKTGAASKTAPQTNPGAPKTPRTCVLVLGMHRSGTSAFTRVLNLLGCAVPRSLMAANANNPTGFWESVKVFHLNTRLLASAGSAWDDWLAFPDAWYRSPPAQTFEAEARELLAEEFGDAPFFALKDPRLCRILPFWMKVLEAHNTRAAALIPLRHPLEVAGSMQSRDGFDPAYGALLWLRHVLDAEHLSRGMTRLFVHYDDLLADWQSVIARTETAFGFAWPGHGDAARGAIASYLTPSLRHHALGEDAIASHPTLPVQVGQAYAILKSWAQNGEKPADHARLDTLRAELDAMGTVFGNIIAAGRAAQEREADLIEERDTLSQSVEALKIKSETAAQDADDLRHARNAMAEALSHERETCRVLTQSVEDMRHARNLMAEALERERKTAADVLETTRGRLEHERNLLAEALENERKTAADLLETTRGTLEHERNLLAEALENEREARAAGAAALQSLTGESERERKAAAEALEALRNTLVHERNLLAEALEAERQQRTELEASTTREREALRRALEESRAKTLWMRQALGLILPSGDGTRRLALSMLPAAWNLRKARARLKREGVFDGAAYLEANPDLPGHGVDPLTHYVRHGIAEGRPAGQPRPRLR